MTFRSIPVSNDPAQDLCWDWWDWWMEAEAGCEDPEQRRAEKEAWKNYADFTENVKAGGEWDVPEGTETQLLDEAEMFWDMNKEEEEMNCHHLFRRSVWEERGVPDKERFFTGIFDEVKNLVHPFASDL